MASLNESFGRPRPAAGSAKAESASEVLLEEYPGVFHVGGVVRLEPRGGARRGWTVLVVNEGKLSTVLREFARTMSTDFPIQGILDQLVERIVEILPVTAAGVTLISAGEGPRYVAASDASAMRFERLQTRLDEGPCLLAYNSGESVAVPDLNSEVRFPAFTSAALAAGLVAVFTFPLRHDGGSLGALDLYRDTPGRLDAHDMEAAQTLADVATAYLLNARARDDARVTSEQFQRSSLHDPLTGLPNQVLLRERLDHAAKRSKRSTTSSAVLFVDLDRFKAVNDAHGHQVGNELLAAVAHRLSALIRPGDTLARFAGDEFVFLCEDLTSAADVETLAERIDVAFADPFTVGNVALAVTASVGMAYAGPGHQVSSQLLADADIAMYQAKRKGGAGHQVIDLREALISTNQLSLERDLRAALANDDLEVFYQPVVQAADGRMTGVEALLRWSHPERGAVPPLSMIGAAEQSGLINELGAWVLRTSCHDHHQWLHDHPNIPLDVAVNVSPRQLMHPTFPATVARVLDDTDMTSSHLVLEITENHFVEDSENAITVLNDLKALGIRIALDDFGTGYSSLSYLRRLPIDIIKIDRAFITDIGNTSNGDGDAIVAGVTDLAHALRLAVTAEGVETQQQRDAIISIGCDTAQGFYYARPMPVAGISAHLIACSEEKPPAHQRALRATGDDSRRVRRAYDVHSAERVLHQPTARAIPSVLND